ncbi:MAG: hypothetical protein PHC34_02295 [Candidatus Gastranaerophilales bacterium]|nr:hypothetical protein [Candidatus Gastranaerophilales bacterium]
MIDNVQENKRLIGIWGYPDPDVLKHTQSTYPAHEIIDLDINYNHCSSNVLPDAYCRIITNIIDNALYLKDHLDVIIASVGEEKCDNGRFAAKILSDMGFNIIQTKYCKYNDSELYTPISESNLPLKNKIIRIMDGIIKQTNTIPEKCEPEFGFWGVPPNDLSILDLFPDKTHVFGWTRCVEAGRPADLDLEMLVNKSIPTVFFAQTFCAKMQLAKYLAKKYNGLYVDVDDIASNSVRAKIEAYIRLG